MKGNSSIISALNTILTIELTSINQYFLHARIFKNWGLKELDEKEYKKSIKDMKQADELIARILFLEGLPNLQRLDKIRIGEDTEEMLACDLELQQEQIAKLRESIALCESENDYISRKLLADILEYEESHLDWLETQQFLISASGSQNYLQSMMEG